MAYIGNKPVTGNFRKCDAITTSATATYNLLVDSVAVNPNQNQCVVSLNGVVQSSGDSYTIASSQITFASALTSSDVIDFILILGDVLDVGTVSDDTVSTAKLQANSVTTAKITDGNVTAAKFNADVISGQTALGATPADTDEFLVSDAGTLKRVDYSYIKGITQTSFLPTAQPLIINGDMQVAQRSTSVTGITNDGYHTCDRFNVMMGSIGTWTQTQETLTSGNAYANGFQKAWRIDCTTADASPAASAYMAFQYYFEGQDVQVFKKGTANAQKYTLAFWVKSNKTGTGQINLYDYDAGSRLVGGTYTISSANTWEHKVVNFPADTTGVIDNDNAKSFSIVWWLDSGTNFSSGTTPTAWEAENNPDRNASGTLALADSTANDWAITGIQLEVGEYTSADLPPFRHESYGDNLARCQRYAYMAFEGDSKNMAVGSYRGASEVQWPVIFPVTMRTAPTVTANSGSGLYKIKSDTFDSVTIQNSGITNAGLYNNSEVSGTLGQAFQVQTNDAAAKILFEAEL